MSADSPQVYIVDDDLALCDALRDLLDAHGLSTQIYASGEQFLAARTGRERGCLLLDLRMRGMSGFDVLARVSGDSDPLPVIMLTGHGDVPSAVRATKMGALDFLEKPISDRSLLERIHFALALDRDRRLRGANFAEMDRRLNSLTPRESQILELVIAGRSNKQIATELHIALKTVEVHRKNMMSKMGAANAPDLVALVLQHRAGHTGPAEG